MKVVDTVGLPFDCALVEIEGVEVLLLDASMNHDERMEVMSDALVGKF